MFYLWRRRGRQIKSRLLNSNSSSTMSSTNATELLAYIEKWEIRCDDVKYSHPHLPTHSTQYHMKCRL